MDPNARAKVHACNMILWNKGHQPNKQQQPNKNGSLPPKFSTGLAYLELQSTIEQKDIIIVIRLNHLFY